MKIKSEQTLLQKGRTKTKASMILELEKNYFQFPSNDTTIPQQQYSRQTFASVWAIKNKTGQIL